MSVVDMVSSLCIQCGGIKCAQFQKQFQPIINSLPCPVARPTKWDIRHSLSLGLHIIEKFGWWLHILVVFGFINYLPKSKHLHIFFAFPNTYYSKLDSRGKMENMDSIMNEVKSMMDPEAAFDESAEMEELPVFGSNDVTTLSWRNLLESYTCTECGRCTSVCPANMTGKKLSPRKVMMDIRDRAEEVGDKIRSGKSRRKNKNRFSSRQGFLILIALMLHLKNILTYIRLIQLKCQISRRLKKIWRMFLPWL